MADFINTIDILGDDGLADAIVSDTLEELCDDAVTKLGYQVLANNSVLKKIHVPNVSSFYASAYMCTSLHTVIAPAATEINSYSFINCSSLNALVLGGATMCSLGNKNALTGTPIASGTGYVYVPSALVDSYKAATNWSTYADQFRALEDYTVDGTTTGELDETKI